MCCFITEHSLPSLQGGSLPTPPSPGRLQSQDESGQSCCRDGSQPDVELAVLAAVPVPTQLHHAPHADSSSWQQGSPPGTAPCPRPQPQGHSHLCLVLMLCPQPS